MKVIPTLHPAALMRDPTLWGAVVADLERAKAQAGTPTYSAPNVEWVPVETVAQLRITLAALPSSLGPTVLDVETSGLTLMCVGLCQTPPLAYVIDGRIVQRATRTFQAWLNKQTIIMHNAVFDIGVLTRAGLHVPTWEDTMLLHHTCYAELPHSLAFIQSIYTPLPYHKHLAPGHTQIEESTDAD